MSKKVMISQPMAGKTVEEIRADRDRAAMAISNMGCFDEVVDTLFNDFSYNPKLLRAGGVKQVALYMLGSALRCMSQCDAVYFCDGWESARGCQIEHAAAEAYGLETIYEEPKEKTDD